MSLQLALDARHSWQGTARWGQNVLTGVQLKNGRNDSESNTWSENGLAPVKLRMQFPLLSTSPLKDVHLLMLLTPVLWFLGLEQLVGVPILIWSAIKLGLKHRPIRISVAAVTLIILIGTMILSLPAIESPTRYLTFVRTLSMYLMGVLLFVILQTECRSFSQVRALLRSLVWMMGMAGALALLGVLGISELNFRSPAGYLLPGIIADTGYGNQIVWRSLGNQSWFRGFGSYFQVNGIFLFSTMNAAAAAITLPLSVYFLVTSRGMWKIAYFLLSALIMVSLVFSTGRVAWLSVSLAVVIIGAFSFRLYPRTIMLLLGAACIATMLFILPSDAIPSAVESTIYARGAGSTNSRLTIYSATLEGFTQKPLFGWGTERDITAIENFVYPAGSHSHYLGFLFKHGIVGFAVLVFFILFITLSIAKVPRVTYGNTHVLEAQRLLPFVKWSLLTALFIGLTSVLDLDATLILIVWVVIAAALLICKFLTAAATDQVQGPSEP